MKNLFPAALILLSIIALPGCTKIIYTHQQVIDSYKTKDQLTKQFGIPTQKKMAGDTEEWLYRYEMSTTGKAVVRQAENVRTADVTEFTLFKRYIIFDFDKQGNITGRRSEGVDFTQKEKAPGKTIALIGGCVAVTVAVVWVATNAILKSSFSYGGSWW